MIEIPTTAQYYRITALAEWEEVVPKLFAQAGDSRVWAFYGDLGAGKTTCIKALCRHLGVMELVTSPSFGLLHTYQSSQNGSKVYHGDFYRLKSSEEALDIGLENYVVGEEYFFLEWPQIVAPILPRPFFNVAIGCAAPEERWVAAWTAR